MRSSHFLFTAAHYSLPLCGTLLTSSSSYSFRFLEFVCDGKCQGSICDIPTLGCVWAKIERKRLPYRRRTLCLEFHSLKWAYRNRICQFSNRLRISTRLTTKELALYVFVLLDLPLLVFVPHLVYETLLFLPFFPPYIAFLCHIFSFLFPTVSGHG